MMSNDGTRARPRVAIVDTDGLNPYGLGIVRSVEKQGTPVTFFRRSAPVSWDAGTAFGPERGTTGTRLVRAIQLLHGVIRTSWGVRSSRVVHVLWETLPDAMIAVAAKVLWRTRLVVSIHDPFRPQRSARLATRVLLAIADDVVMHNASLAEKAKRRYGDSERRLTVFPLPNLHGIGTEVTRAASREHFGLTGPAVTFFGQIRPYKGIDLFVRCCRDIAVAQPDAQFLIVGTVQDAALRRIVDRFASDLPDRVILHVDSRPISADVIEAALAASDVVLLPFRTAAQSGSLTHALSRGCAVVTTNVGDAAIPAACGAVEVVEPGDAAGLEQLCRSLLTDTDRRARLAAKALAYADGALDSDNAGDILVRLYEAT